VSPPSLFRSVSRCPCFGHHGVTFNELIDGVLHVLCLLGQDSTLCAVGKSGKVETTALYKQLYEAAGDIKPKNISIDTLSRAFSGNEIDRVQVYGFANHMQALAMVAGGAVAVLSHPSLAGMSSGSGISGSTETVGQMGFDLAVQANHAYSMGVASFGLGHALLHQGRIADAIHILERGYGQTKLHSIEGTIRSRLSYAYAQAGRSDEARELAQIELPHFTPGGEPAVNRTASASLAVHLPVHPARLRRQRICRGKGHHGNVDRDRDRAQEPRSGRLRR
jgi:hypothetical protein